MGTYGIGIGFLFFYLVFLFHVDMGKTFVLLVFTCVWSGAFLGAF